MKFNLQIDAPLAVKIAQYLEMSGMQQYANDMWLELSASTAHDRPLREELADTLYELRQAPLPRGTVARSRFLLGLMSVGFPSRKLVAAYFDNLEQLLAQVPRRNERGAVVLGIGSGRCGSTTLTAAFSAVPGACATHENPPKIYWQPLDEQIRFHLRRLRVLSDYFPLVFDAAHWWIHLLDPVFAEIPGARVIGLVRDHEDCAKSFLKIQGRGRQSLNHWAPPNSGLWVTHAWDPAFPTYPVPPGVQPDTDEAYATKYAMILRYVREYNETLTSLAARYPDRILLARTEELNDPATIDRLRSFVNVPLAMPDKALNVGHADDGALPNSWL